MPIGDPRDGLFYPTLTLMIDSYIPLPQPSFFYWDIGKQWPRIDATECTDWSGSSLLAYKMFYQYLQENDKNHPATLQMEMVWSGW